MNNKDIRLDTEKPIEPTNISRAPQPSLLDIFTFIGGLAIAYFLGWSTKDLVWSFWAASLVSGFAIQFYMKLAPAAKQHKNAAEWGFTVIGTLFGMAFFSVHFGFFHYIFASMLDMLMPLMPHPGREYVGHLTWRGNTEFDFFATMWTAVGSYWYFALISIAHDYKVFQTVPAKDQYFEPYKKILKIFFLMFLLGGFFELGLESLPVHLLILLLYFAPNGLWGWIFSSLTNKKATVDKTAAERKQ
ncbi:MAG: DUF6498-containing protein [Ignavibacteriae bacterium]|nr:DUF6498-containing protein [Ignavibacteriota bacterium]